MRKFFVAVLTVIVCAGCAAPRSEQARQGPARFQWGQQINFGGWSFDFQDASSASSFFNWLGQRTDGANFVIVDVTMTNRTGEPQPLHFQPIFRLMDRSGALYEPSAMHTAMINMQKAGRPQPGQAINPNTPTRTQIVFEAPRGEYQVGVIVPNRARAGFGGNITSMGPYFYMDLTPLRR